MIRAANMPLSWPGRPLADLCELYAPDVRWLAPRRNLSLQGREVVIAALRREIESMQVIDFNQLRRLGDGQKIIDEYAVRFMYLGFGIDGVSFSAGDHVELERLRVLTLENGIVSCETCIETWTVLNARPSGLF